MLVASSWHQLDIYHRAIFFYNYTKKANGKTAFPKFLKLLLALSLCTVKHVNSGGCISRCEAVRSAAVCNMQHLYTDIEKQVSQDIWSLAEEINLLASQRISVFSKATGTQSYFLFVIEFQQQLSDSEQVHQLSGVRGDSAPQVCTFVSRILDQI